MLSQKNRLSKSAEVKQTTAKGRGFFNPYFVIKSVPTKDLPKFTVVVSTKVAKRAVDRNRIKRIIRDEIRKVLPNIKPGNYAILAKASILKITPALLREEIIKSMHMGKILQ